MLNDPNGYDWGHISSDVVDNLAAPSDWPMPAPPPYPADDEADTEPTDEA